MHSGIDWRYSCSYGWKNVNTLIIQQEHVGTKAFDSLILPVPVALDFARLLSGNACGGEAAALGLLLAKLAGII